MESSALPRSGRVRDGSKTLMIALAGFAALALIVPAAAAAHIQTGVDSVRAHTDRADAALDRAVALFEANRNQRGQKALARSRSQMGQATSEAAKLRGHADNRSERVEAARAFHVLGDRRCRNVRPLVGVLDEARGKAEHRVAQAALQDTRGRDKAIAVLSALLEDGLPSQAERGIARAMTELSQGRDAQAVVEADALTSDEVSPKSKRRVATAARRSINGQATAAERLAELIASDEMPEQSKFGLQRAYDAVISEQEAAADTLAEFSDRMPARIRAFVEQIVQQARENAQGLRENRPTPPAGPGGFPGEGQAPPGTPNGPPSGTPNGPPSETPAP